MLNSNKLSKFSYLILYCKTLSKWALILTHIMVCDAELWISIGVLKIIFYIQRQHAVSVALHMLLNYFSNFMI